MKKTALANLDALPRVIAILYVVTVCLVALTAGVQAARAAEALTAYNAPRVVVGLLAGAATLFFFNRGMFWLLDRLARDGAPVRLVVARFAVILGAVVAGIWVGLNYFDYFAGFSPAMTIPGRVVIGLAFAAGVAGWLIALGFWAARSILNRGRLALPRWRQLAQSEPLWAVVALCFGTYVAAQFFTVDDQSGLGTGLLVGVIVTMVVLLGAGWLMTVIEDESKRDEAAAVPRRATVHSLAAHLRKAYPPDGEPPVSPHVVQVFAPESPTTRPSGLTEAAELGALRDALGLMGLDPDKFAAFFAGAGDYMEDIHKVMLLRSIGFDERRLQAIGGKKPEDFAAMWQQLMSNDDAQ